MPGSRPAARASRGAGATPDARGAAARARARGRRCSSRPPAGAPGGAPPPAPRSTPKRSCDHLRLRLLAARHDVRAARAFGLGALTTPARPAHRRGAAALAELVGVRVGGEDLPRRAVGVVDPDLVLARVAAGRVHLVERRETRGDEALLGGEHVAGRRDLDAGVVERAEPGALARV